MSRFEDMEEEELIEVLQRGDDLDDGEFEELTAAMKEKGMKGSIFALGDPFSDEAEEMIAYVKFHEKVKKTTAKDVVWSKKILNSKKSKLDDKKKAIIHLAHSGKLDSYKFLKKYEKSAEAKLSVWVNTAIQECQVFMESELLDRPVVKIKKIPEK